MSPRTSSARSEMVRVADEIPTGGGEGFRVPAWAAGIIVSLLLALTGTAISIAFRSGAIVDGIERLTGTVERIDTRTQRIEIEHGNRLTAIEARSGVAPHAMTTGNQ